MARLAAEIAVSSACGHGNAVGPTSITFNGFKPAARCAVQILDVGQNVQIKI